MSGYWLGLATLPALFVVGALLLAVVPRVAALIVGVCSFTAKRIRPDAPAISARRRATAIYAARSGLMLAKGNFAVVLIAGGLDPERRQWADDQLREPLRTLRRIRGDDA